MIKRKDVSSSKLLGYLLQEGLDSLAYEHVPNGRNYKACVFCSRSDQVSVPFTNVKLQPCTGKDIGNNIFTHDPTASHDVKI